MSVSIKDKTTGEWVQVAGGTLYADAPIGSIIPYGGTTAPDGFLLCQGQAVSRTTYAELFKVIGTAFGAGDGSTTFNVPDLREATTKGVGLSGKSSNHFDSDGVALGEFVEDRVQDHLHRTKLQNQYFQDGSKNIAPVTENGSSGIGEVGEIVSGRHGATTEVKAVGINYIIKATQVSVPADFAPVDVVENGNMKAVTSNAVAKMCKHISAYNLNKVIPTTGTVVIQLTLPKGKWMVFGQLHTNGFASANQLLTLAISVNGTASPKEVVDQKAQIPGYWIFVQGMLYLEPTTEVTVKLVAVATEQIAGVVKAEMLAIPVAG